MIKYIDTFVSMIVYFMSLSVIRGLSTHFSQEKSLVTFSLSWRLI